MARKRKGPKKKPADKRFVKTSITLAPTNIAYGRRRGQKLGGLSAYLNGLVEADRRGA